jgi:hypothetical protein
MRRRLALKYAVAAVIVTCLQCGPSRADTLGRLFFTPKERLNLDLARSGQVTQSDAPVIPSAPEQISGYVQRNDGKSTVWINGAARYDSTVRRMSPQIVRTPSDVSIRGSAQSPLP